MKKALITIILCLQAIFTFEALSAPITDGVDVFEVYTSTHNGAEIRSQSISADITGHVLTITFNEDVGIANITIRNSNGIYIDRENVLSTPDHAIFTINDAGNYRMDITLSNGKQYYGYFQVEN